MFVGPMRRWRAVAFWTCFAVAAVVFVLDATMTMHVAALHPMAVEQNPIARWTLEIHPLAPYMLKAGIVAVCAAVAGILRTMGERGWAVGVVVMMAVVGLTGIATGLQVVRTSL